MASVCAMLCLMDSNTNTVEQELILTGTILIIKIDVKCLTIV